MTTSATETHESLDDFRYMPESLCDFRYVRDGSSLLGFFAMIVIGNVAAGAIAAVMTLERGVELSSLSHSG
ncbi:hypothetical protein GCM10023156_65870 [Novipirellula rosea]|uniref:Uncharacterized protein n=1 Tax=Novipirellula rosea TaxID=1031540 RepID=A0ABP8NUK4_9BACT